MEFVGVDNFDLDLSSFNHLSLFAFFFISKFKDKELADT